MVKKVQTKAPLGVKTKRAIFMLLLTTQEIIFTIVPFLWKNNVTAALQLQLQLEHSTVL